MSDVALLQDVVLCAASGLLNGVMPRFLVLRASQALYVRPCCTKHAYDDALHQGGAGIASIVVSHILDVQRCHGGDQKTQLDYNIGFVLSVLNTLQL